MQRVSAPRVCKRTYHSPDELRYDSIAEAIAIIVRDPAYARQNPVIGGHWRELLDPAARTLDYLVGI